MSGQRKPHQRPEQSNETTKGGVYDKDILVRFNSPGVGLVGSGAKANTRKPAPVVVNRPLRATLQRKAVCKVRVEATR